MSLPTYKCVVCGKSFVAGDYLCQTGDKHVCESVTFYLDDAPSDPRSFRDSRTTIMNMIPERTLFGDDGKSRTQPGISAEFVRGVMSTTDPEMMYQLTKSGKCCSKERWEEVYLTDSDKAELRNIKLRNENARLEQERNELLALVKNQKRVAAVA